MAVYGQPKGKDAKVQNESSEPKHGLSKTEIAAMMRKMSGDMTGQGPPLLPASALMPKGKK